MIDRREMDLLAAATGSKMSTEETAHSHNVLGVN